MPAGTSRLIDRDPRRGSRCVTVIGAGPRGIGWLERFVENHPEYGSMPVVVHLVDPYPAGGGRIWRDAQSDLLRVNSHAADITMFTDDAAEIDGPVATGPSLYAWARGVRDGEIVDGGTDDEPVDAEAEPRLADEIARLEGHDFPSRRLLQRYLAWVFRRTADRLAAGSRIMLHPTMVTAVVDQANGTQRIHLADGTSMTTDVVVYALGHADAEPGAEAAALLEAAQQHGLAYQEPAHTADVDLSRFAPGEPVVVRGMGLAAVDLLVLLTEGRGGRFEEGGDGTGRLRYLPSGREPRILIGSRRGVPFHAKPTGPATEAEPAGRYVTPETLDDLLAGAGRVDFERDVVPRLHSEMLYGTARALFAFHPERTRGTLDDLVAVLDAHPADSAEVTDALVAAFPDPHDRLDLRTFDRPLEGREFADRDALQAWVRDYVRDDLERRTSPGERAAMALYESLLHSYRAIVDRTDRPGWTARSIDGLYRRWQHEFDFVASGPPARRLEEWLALSEAGVLEFLGGELRIDVDEERGEFLAIGAQLAQPVRVSSLIDAWLPATEAETSLDPALRDLVSSGIGRIHVHDDGRDTVSTGRVDVRPADKRIVRPDGSAHGRRFAIGPFTSSPFTGAFARPGSNALAFRENDVVARGVLEVLRTRNDAAVCLADIGPDVSVFDGVVLV